MRKIILSNLALVIFATSVIFSSGIADAATLAMTPATIAITEGKTFTVTVRVNTEGQSVNVASAEVSYPTDLLQAIGVSQGSTFSIKTPGTPSISGGKVTFSAGIPSPGFAGSKGVLGRITFRAKATGTATIAIASGQVLLNDGNATDALSGTSNAAVTITAAKAKAPVSEKVPEPAPVVETVPATEVPATVVVPEVMPVPAVTNSVTTTLSSQPNGPLSATIVITISNVMLLIYILVGTIVVLLIVVILLLVRLLLLPHRKEHEDRQVVTIIEKKKSPSAKPRPKKKPSSTITVETL